LIASTVGSRLGRPRGWANAGTIEMKIPYRFLKDQGGATAIEYAAIAVFLSIVTVTVVTGIGATLKTKLMEVQFPGT
jgi:Flp pilus assembly pilin Flp